MTQDVRQYFPLNNAYLCQDCDSIGNNSMHCPACASDVLMALKGVLNRKQASKSRIRSRSDFSEWRSQLQTAA
jgi:hypothetical protein